VLCDEPLYPYRSVVFHGTIKYLGATVTDENCVHEEIKSKLNMGNACYHSFERLLASVSSVENIKIKIYKTVILSILSIGVKLSLSH
jgi:hypothetical protein